MGSSPEGEQPYNNPEKLRPLSELTMPSSFKELVVRGIALTPYAREVTLPPTGLVFVGMNSAAYSKIPKDRVGQIYTVAIAGCTGAAGIAKINEGVLAGISHFDALVDANQRQQGICPSERFMSQFIRIARKCGAEAIKLSVVYADMHRSDPKYNQFGDDYDDWHFLNQLESFAEEAESDVDVSLKPYKSLASHILAVNVDRNARASVAFK